MTTMLPTPRKRKAADRWCVYIVGCANKALYTGMTNKLEERVAAHNAGIGCRYTASFGPVKLVWHKKVKNLSSALKLEAKIKKLSRGEKKELVRGGKFRSSR